MLKLIYQLLSVDSDSRAAAEVGNVSKPLKAKVVSLMDAVAKSLNAFTGSHEVHMQGDYLGICPDNPDEGVFLVLKN